MVSFIVQQTIVVCGEPSCELFRLGGLIMDDLYAASVASSVQWTQF